MASSDLAFVSGAFEVKLLCGSGPGKRAPRRLVLSEVEIAAAVDVTLLSEVGTALRLVSASIF
jgi:hypothetical protein